MSEEMLANEGLAGHHVIVIIHATNLATKGKNAKQW